MLGVAEGTARVLLRFTGIGVRLHLRSTSEILREQSERIRRLIEPDPTRLLVLDSVLGWRYRANHRDPRNHTNSLGVRSQREYPSPVAPGTLRVAAFGDSFVYGNEVSDSAAWPRQVERLFPDIEVLNYGVGGYGVDQAFLRFLAVGREASPRIAIMGFTEDDLTRVVNVYRRFRSSDEIPLTKPRFLLGRNGRLVLVPPPLRGPADYRKYLADPARVVELGVDDQWYEPLIYRDPLYDYSAAVRLLTGVWIGLKHRYGPDRLVVSGEFNPHSTAFKIQMALFRLFADSARAWDMKPLIVLLPGKGNVSRAREGLPPDFQPLIDSLDQAGIPDRDATVAFRAAPGDVDSRVWFSPGGHYSWAGNHLVAEWLGQQLEKLGR